MNLQGIVRRLAFDRFWLELSKKDADGRLHGRDSGELMHSQVIEGFRNRFLGAHRAASAGPEKRCQSIVVIQRELQGVVAGGTNDRLSDAELVLDARSGHQCLAQAADSRPERGANAL